LNSDAELLGSLVNFSDLGDDFGLVGVEGNTLGATLGVFFDALVVSFFLGEFDCPEAISLTGASVGGFKGC
jgi:hypothetical protein